LGNDLAHYLPNRLNIARLTHQAKGMNGSDELIQLLALACDTGDTILSVEPSFVMYGIIDCLNIRAKPVVDKVTHNLCGSLT
jgi:histidinol-phosphate/aromatic aminotransferase/cobyric acid decarboxylase-like protein